MMVTKPRLWHARRGSNPHTRLKRPLLFGVAESQGRSHTGSSVEQDGKLLPAVPDVSINGYLESPLRRRVNSPSGTEWPLLPFTSVGTPSRSPGSSALPFTS